MNRPTRSQMLLLAAVVLAVVAIAAIAIRGSIGRAPRLGEVKALARLGQFEQARALLDRYLRVHPDDHLAHLLMAQLATEPKSPLPERALEHLHAIKPHSTKEAAIVAFLEGKAQYQRRRYDLAESRWREALRLDPIVPEAGWALVDLLDKESRREEAHRLGMCVHEVEPDPRDRVQILLEMSRLDIETPDPLSQVLLFEPLVKEHPEHLPLCITVGLAMIRVNRREDGVKLLGEALRRNPQSPEAWDALFTGLYDGSEVEELAAEFARLPEALAPDPRFAKHEGMIAQDERDWPRAERAYRRAFAFEPFNVGVSYRYRFVLGQTGDTAEQERVDRFYKGYQSALKEMRRPYDGRDAPGEGPVVATEATSDRKGFYYEVLEIKTLGVEPHPELYQHLAELREKMGRFDEARAWHRLVLRDQPSNALSLSALERLN